jgi:hypothetical protein
MDYKVREAKLSDITYLTNTIIKASSMASL